MGNQDRIKEQYEGVAGQFAEAVDFEKTSIIAPALTDAFNRAVRDKNFNPATDKVIDIGCGPFLLALPLLRDGIHVDGIDITPDMIAQAELTLQKAEADLTVDRDKIKLVSEYHKLDEGSYKFGMLNFVHQCCDTRTALVDLFVQANKLLQPDSRLLLITTHPDFLHIPHAAYACDVKSPRDLKDGDKFGGHIFTNRGAKAFDIENDFFWSRPTILEAAREAGFELVNAEDIDDHPSLVRRESKEPAYLMITFRKPDDLAPRI